MEQVKSSKEAIKNTLDEFRAQRKRFIEKAEKLSESGEHEEAREYCKIISDLSAQIVHFYEMYIQSEVAA